MYAHRWSLECMQAALIFIYVMYDRWARRSAILMCRASAAIGEVAAAVVQRWRVLHFDSVDSAVTCVAFRCLR